MVVLAVIIPLVMLGFLMALDRFEDLVFPAAPAAPPAEDTQDTGTARGTGGPLGTGTRVR
ncbi:MULTISPECIES: hypothetical protein [Streptomyces]|jgi:hypothetical protein|uniref:Uncharacterized protein n=1 Tax=Streptomyces griseoaurantiacus TaxID=68213 RepID=A0A1G7IW31_9ACTN|nr:hypothetical protein [Streptomyces jietaisiensis]SDF16818.1 hypothetical protein SAMN05216260_106191 [Streptomyces jietaisiensis]